MAKTIKARRRSAQSRRAQSRTVFTACMLCGRMTKTKAGRCGWCAR